MKKKDTLYTVNKWNQPMFEPDENVYDIGGLFARPLDRLASKAYGANYGEKGYTLTDYANSKGINAATGAAIGTLAGGLIGNGYTNDNSKTAAAIGGIASAGVNFLPVDPLTKMALSGIVNTGVGLYNRAYGSKWNDGAVANIESNIANTRNIANNIAMSSSTEDFLMRSQLLNPNYSFSQDDLGKDGWRAHAVKDKYEELQNKQNTANAIAAHSLAAGANRVNRLQRDNAIELAYGGPFDVMGSNINGAIDYDFMDRYLKTKEKKVDIDNKLQGMPLTNAFGDGGSIEIKHPGRLTELKKRTGKTEAELWAEGKPSVRKMITFARNARKWNKAYGGFLDAADNLFALGGDLQTSGADYSNGLTHVDAGESHEINPYGGVQMGIDPEGTPNLVEEGEVIFNDYVFSNRIKLDEETKDKLHLPKKRDITYAEAAKRLEKESSERPADPISKAALKAQMETLAGQQEKQKQIMAANTFACGGKVNKYDLGGTIASWLALSNPDVPVTDDIVNAVKNKLAAEGKTNPSYNDITLAYLGLNMPSSSNNAPEGLIRMDSSIPFQSRPILGTPLATPITEQSITQVDVQSKPSATQTPVNHTTFADGPLTEKIPDSSVKKVKTNNSTYTPRVGDSGLVQYGYYTNGSDGYSTPTGFKVGKGGRAYDYTNDYLTLVNKLGANDIRRWAAEHPNDPSLRSFLARGNRLENLTDEQWRKGATDGKYGFMHHVADQMLNNPTPGSPFNGVPNPAGLPMAGFASVAASELPKTIEDIRIKNSPVVTNESDIDNGNMSPKLKPEWLRYVGLFGPAVGLGMQLAGVGKPDYTDLDAAVRYGSDGNTLFANYRPIGNYLTYRPLDIWAEQNRLNANSMATERSLINNTSPSRAAGLLANSYNNQIASGQLFRQAQEYNDNLRKQVADFNRGTDQFNAQAYNNTSATNAQLANNNRHYATNLMMQAAAQKMAADAAWNQGIYGNVAGLFRGISDLGRENTLWNWNARNAADGVYGTMTPDNNTGDLYVEEEKKKAKKKACGGKMKKRGLTF